MKRLSSSLFLAALLLLLVSSGVAKESWPPVLDMPYPNLKLLNQDGKLTELAQFKGKVILIEPIGMTCSACNAFADTSGAGGIGGAAQQQGLPSFHKLAKDYGRVTLPSQDVVVVHLLLYNAQMKPPTLADAKAWSKHFGLSTFDNEYVLVGKKEHQVYELVPGFQLVDREFRLVSDSSGHNPKNDLYKHLFPKLGALVNR